MTLSASTSVARRLGPLSFSAPSLQVNCHQTSTDEGLHEFTGLTQMHIQGLSTMAQSSSPRPIRRARTAPRHTSLRHDASPFGSVRRLPSFLPLVLFVPRGFPLFFYWNDHLPCGELGLELRHSALSVGVSTHRCSVVDADRAIPSPIQPTANSPRFRFSRNPTL